MCTVDLQSKIAIHAVANTDSPIDTALFEALTFVFRATSTTVVTLQHSDSIDSESGELENPTEVDAVFLLGPTTFTDPGAYAVGYVGKLRYAQITVTNPVAGASAFAIEAARDRDGEYQDVDKTT